MNHSKLLFVNILATISFVVLIAFFTKDTFVVNKSIDKDALFVDNWTVQTNSINSIHKKLPLYLHTNHEQRVWLSKTLSGINTADFLIFFSFQQQVRVFLDDVEVYSFLPENVANSKTPGNKWNIIPLSENDNGKTLTICLYECYRKNRISIPTIYCGTYKEVIMPFIRSQLPCLFSSAIIVFFSFIIFVFYILFRKSTNLSVLLPWLAAFSFFRGCWSFIENNSYSLFYGHLLITNHLSFLFFKLATLSFLIFINVAFHNGKSRFLKGIVYISFADFWISVISQLAGIADFANTVFITHIILLISGLFIVSDGIYVLVGQHKLYNPIKHINNHAYIAHIGCIILVSITSQIDLFYYYYANRPDKAYFSRIVDLIYMTVISSPYNQVFFSINSILFDTCHLIELRLWSDLYLVQGRYIVIMGTPNKTSSLFVLNGLDVYPSLYGSSPLMSNRIILLMVGPHFLRSAYP